MTRFRSTCASTTAGFGGQIRFMLPLSVAVLSLSACSDVTGQVQDSLGGALAPVKDAIDEAARRANEVGEGINQVADGIQRVQGALSGSGSRF